MKASFGKHKYLVGALAVLLVVALAVGWVMNLTGGGREEAAEVESITLPGDELSPVEKFAKAQGADVNTALGAVAPAPAAHGAPLAAEVSSLEAMLPLTLSGEYQRVSMSSKSSGAAGMGPSSAEAIYRHGAAELRVKVADMGPLGAMTSISNGQTTTIGGRTVIEDADPEAKTAKYAILGRYGAVLTADASAGATLDDAKAAVTVVGIDRLEAVAAR